MTEGWKCPVCGKGVAPTEKTCDHGAAGLPDMPVPTAVPNGLPTSAWPHFTRPTTTWGGLTTMSGICSPT